MDMILRPMAIEKFNIFSDSAWCFVSDSNILVCGGGREVSSEYMKNAYNVTLSGDRGEVTTLASMHTRKSFHAIYPYRDLVYTFGGRDEYGTELTNFEEYAKSADEWSILPNLPYCIDKGTVTEKGGILYFCGLWPRYLCSYNPKNRRFDKINFILPRSKTKLLCAIPDRKILTLITESSFITIDSDTGAVISEKSIELGELEEFWSNMP